MMKADCEKPLKNRGLNDRLYVANLLFAWVYTYVCIILTIFGMRLGIEDYSFVSVGLPIVWGELSLHTGFFVWKSKCENISKYGNTENITM